MPFVCLTKYNDVGMNHLSLLDTSDEIVAKGSRAEQRKVAKKEKDAARASHALGTRGIGIDRQLQVIEIVQLEDCKKMDNITETIAHLTSRCDIILRERSQQMEMAKIIFPEYDKNDENWVAVTNLTRDLAVAKKEVAEYEKQKIECMTKKSTSSELTRELLNTLHSFKGSPKKPTKVQKHTSGSDVSSSITMASTASIESTSDVLSRSLPMTILDRSSTSVQPNRDIVDDTSDEGSKVSH